MRAWLLAACLLATALAVAFPPAEAAEAATVRVDGFFAAYGSEAWKDESAALGNLFKNSPFPTNTPLYRGTYLNPYQDPTRPHAQGAGNYWGYNLTLDLTVVDAAGKPVEAADGSYLLDAKIVAPGGTVPAKLVKANASSFRATFDLDGENGKTFPALRAGNHEITVDVFLSARDPTVVGDKVATTAVPFRVASVFLDKTGVDLPDRVLPTYTDAAAGNTTSFHATLLAPNAPVHATVSTGVPNASAVLLLVSERRATPVFEGDADALGRAQATFEPSAAMGGAETGLLLLEGHLTGEDRVVGNGVVALPVSSRAVPITTIEFEPRALGPNAVPQLATVRVVAEDRNGTPEMASRQGTLFLAKGNAIFSQATFPPPTFAPNTLAREVRFQASVVPRGYNQYNLLAIFLDQSNRFYSFAIASRGVSIAASDATHAGAGEGQLDVLLRSFTTNLDNASDSGLSASLTFTASGLPGGKSASQEVVLDEGAEERLRLAFPANAEGAYEVVLNATLGDVSTGRVVTLTLTGEPSLLDDVLGAPAPGLALALGALALVALTRSRRRAP